jgi:hypothetical protein
MTEYFNSDTFEYEMMQAIEKYQDFYEVDSPTRGEEAPTPPKETAKEAKKLLERKDIRHYICPALQSISKDAYDIGKTIAAILIPLALAKTILIPLDPIVFGLMAIMISKMGIASLCADYENKKDEKD